MVIMQETAIAQKVQAPPSLRELGYYDDTEVAQLLKIAPTTLRNWRSKGIGPDFTQVHGFQIAYPIDGVRAWLKSRTVKAQKAGTMIDGRRRRT
jgi:hypothetical protein